jgi:methionine sulfoxide reductase heme-binding subunit
LTRARLRFPKAALYAFGFAPAVWLFGLGVADALGADPIATLERSLGLWALRFLLACLAITPLRRLLRLDLMRYRRALGLLAFYYAVMHVLAYVALDHGFDWGAIVADVIKRPYVTLGALALLVLIPLALTSNNASIARLGGKIWARLHRLVYLGAFAAAAHFLLVVKSWPAEPLAYAAITAALLSYRALAPVPRKRPWPLARV